MYNETTLMVNVDATSKKLSDTAVNLWIANEVVLELDQPDAPDVESGKSFYAQMTKKVLSDGAQGVTDGYYFTFDTGDVFFSATANGYPELVGDTLNIGTDNGGGGSGGDSTGGGGAVAHATYEIDEATHELASIVLDMTVDEIVAAEGNVSVVVNLGNPEHPLIAVGRVVEINGAIVKVIGIPAALNDNYYEALVVFAYDDGYGHPAWYASGGDGPK